MIELKDGRYYVHGPITLVTVEPLLHEGAARFASDNSVVDLGGVTQADSAAVALLLRWTRDARAAGREIKYVNVGRNVRALISLYDVGAFLPVI
jgi:phospholipid transport system transporter-binding protein